MLIIEKASNQCIFSFSSVFFCYSRKKTFQKAFPSAMYIRTYVLVALEKCICGSSWLWIMTQSIIGCLYVSMHAHKKINIWKRCCQILILIAFVICESIAICMLQKIMRRMKNSTRGIVDSDYRLNMHLFLERFNKAWRVEQWRS